MSLNPFHVQLTLLWQQELFTESETYELLLLDPKTKLREQAPAATFRLRNIFELRGVRPPKAKAWEEAGSSSATPERRRPPG